VNTILDNLKLEKHPDKTFIGRIDRGFDFLGYRFVAEGLRLAAQTKQRFVERATRLYEQGAAASRIGEYVRHWLTWVRSGCLEHVWDEFLDGVSRGVGIENGLYRRRLLPNGSGHLGLDRKVAIGIRFCQNYQRK
jgi:hypothetical protein